MFGNGNTAVRAGVGQFFQRERVSIALGMVANAPFALNVGGTRTLDVTGPGSISVDGPPGGAPSRSQDPAALLPNTWQWNLTVDQKLSKEAVLEIGYVGNRALHQLISYDVNQAPQNRIWLLSVAATAAVSTRSGLRNFGLSLASRAGSADYHSSGPIQDPFPRQVSPPLHVVASIGTPA